MNWYDDAVYSMKPNTVYTRSTIVDELKANHPSLSDNSYQWAVGNMLRSGLIERTGFDQYMLPDSVTEKNHYHPFYSELSRELISKLGPKYPYFQFTVFETVLMNEFLNHLIGRNTVFIQVEKEYSIFVFRFLQESGYHNIMYKPSPKDYSLYWEPNSIVLTDMISEAPIDPDDQHSICIEKMLVDMYCDKLISTTFSRSEYPSVMKNARELYQIEDTKLLRYARRRNKDKEIRSIITELSD